MSGAKQRTSGLTCGVQAARLARRDAFQWTGWGVPASTGHPRCRALAYVVEQFGRDLRQGPTLRRPPARVPRPAVRLLGMVVYLIGKQCVTVVLLEIRWAG
jgi:hypothetical protein